jgi:deazaflavin-dependent oxidoreductase (nitroreductase family)
MTPPTPAPSAPPPARLAALAARVLRCRLIVRAPIALYRARLGFLFGSRLLMLEHTGRMTGARRHVVLEVVDHPQPGTYIVASGFGARAQWLRNVRADPSVRVCTGFRPPTTATARLLTSEEAAAAFDAYATRHPRAWALLRPVFEQTMGARVDRSGISLPLVALDLADR